MVITNFLSNMRFTKLMMALFIIVFASCVNDKNYEFHIDNHEISILIPPPYSPLISSGSLWRFDLYELEEDIFDSLRRFGREPGIYAITLHIDGKDKYGNQEISDLGIIGSIDLDEVKRYKEYKYFQGKISGMMYEACFGDFER